MLYDRDCRFWREGFGLVLEQIKNSEENKNFEENKDFEENKLSVQISVLNLWVTI